MSTKLVEFLVALAKDPARVVRFRADPEKELEGSGLSPAERELVIEGELGGVRAALDGVQIRERVVLVPVNVEASLEVDSGLEGQPLTAPGKLIVVGTGIRLVAHVSEEARYHIENADKVYYLVTDAAAAEWIHQLNYRSESLHVHLAKNKPRRASYEAMIERILQSVAQGLDVCAAFYGHPGVFVYPSHEVVRRARDTGIDAVMLPAISAEDCLFADLAVDVAAGCLSFESTNFLVYRRTPDPTCNLVLWQIGLIGTVDHAKDAATAGLRLLGERLAQWYPPSHTAVLYEASQFPTCAPKVIRTTLGDFANARVTPFTTLYVPPVGPGEMDQDMLGQFRHREAGDYGSLAAWRHYA